ncbi:MAG: transposase [Candidatus Omnitrophica bacterium CG_4_10_14_0_2_um_filter_44_9]|nr:MAG: transposase [Candidatus Omnitrophica bacterium CG_4_10_14_0_8_um_filter_44_12]PIZ84220.1 MAG: transposase [Candidatus Omnitrophica bacterium CG_4_10_14_0_2_um_filter_44_9]
MARIARIVVPNIPHHIIQRGNRSQKVFFSDNDKTAYLNLLHKHTREAGISLWAYCLMDNHVHLIAVPEREDSLAKGIGDTHKYYTRMINFRENWRGYLWQGRFSSFPLDEKYLYAAVRYVERNPVRAGIVKNAQDYEFSSARAHINKTNDPLLSNNFLTEEIKDWKAFLLGEDKEQDTRLFKKHARVGRPLGEAGFIRKIENMTGRVLRLKRPGRKGRNSNQLNKPDGKKS